MNRDHFLARMSTSLRTSAIEVNRREIEQLGRRTLAASQCRAMLVDLKDRIARRTALRVVPNVVMAEAELPSQAA